jgi:hypothetical protein
MANFQKSILNCTLDDKKKRNKMPNCWRSAKKKNWKASENSHEKKNHSLNTVKDQFSARDTSLTIEAWEIIAAEWNWCCHESHSSKSMLLVAAQRFRLFAYWGMKCICLKLNSNPLELPTLIHWGMKSNHEHATFAANSISWSRIVSSFPLTNRLLRLRIN